MPDWSTAKFWSFIRSGLRAKWTRWPPKYEALRDVRRPYVGENKRQKYEFQCARCEGWFIQKSVEVDHIEPVGTLRDYSDLPEFVRRLFVSKEKLRVVCKACHLLITAEDKAAKGRE